MKSRTVNAAEIRRILAGDDHELLTEMAISKFVAEGMPKAARGKYDPEKCTSWYIGRLRTAVQRRQVEGEDGKMVSLDDAQIRLTLAKAENEEMTARERRGELMPLTLHQSEVSKLAFSLRQKFLSLPGRAASELEGLARGEIKIVLTAQIKSILSAFASDSDDSDICPAAAPTSATRPKTRARTPRRTERTKPLARPVPKKLAK